MEALFLGAARRHRRSFVSVCPKMETVSLHSVLLLIWAWRTIHHLIASHSLSIRVNAPIAPFGVKSARQRFFNRLVTEPEESGPTSSWVVLLCDSPSPAAIEIEDRLDYREKYMSLSLLLEKLLDIQNSVGVETDTVVKNKLMDAQDYVLAMEKERLSGDTGDSKRLGIHGLISHIYSRV